MSDSDAKARVSDTDVPRLARGCRFGREDGVLMLPEGMLKLSETGLKIVALCDGHHTVGEIVAEIQKTYSNDLHVRIRADVIDYLGKLALKKAVELG